MATIREYFDADFGHAVRIHVRLGTDNLNVKAMIVYDFFGRNAFFSCYVSGLEHEYEFFAKLLKMIQPGKTQVYLDGKVGIPSARDFPGSLKIETAESFEVLAKFFGDTDWLSSKQITMSQPSRVFIYAESDLTEAETMELKKTGATLGLDVQFRSQRHVKERTLFESPVGFISHDSRDGAVARQIAIKLRSMLLPVWYDEFSLRVGDKLRESIEKGLKECHKCIILLSNNFFTSFRTMDGQSASSTRSSLG